MPKKGITKDESLLSEGEYVKIHRAAVARGDPVQGGTIRRERSVLFGDSAVCEAGTLSEDVFSVFAHRDRNTDSGE